MSLLVERHGRVGIVTLDDPERRNALNTELVGELVAACDELERDDGIGALVITGTDPAFCAGADLGDLAMLSGDDDTASALRDIYEGFLRVHRSPLPVVAAVNGPAVGAGFNLALAADVRLAAPQARFDARFLRLGLHPGGGHVWLLERAVGPQTAAAIVLFHQTVDGSDAARLGLAWSCVPADELLAAAVALGDLASSVPTELVARAKRTLREAPFQLDFDAAVEAEVARQVWSVHTTREL